MLIFPLQDWWAEEPFVELGPLNPWGEHLPLSSFCLWITYLEVWVLTILHLHPSNSSCCGSFFISSVVKNLFCSSSGSSHRQCLCKSCNFGVPIGGFKLRIFLLHHLGHTSVLLWIFTSPVDFIAQISSLFQVTAVTMNILLKIMNDKMFLWSESCSVVSNSLRPHGLHSPWNSLGQNTGVGSLSLLQRIFPTQGSNPGLSHCRPILYHLSHKGSPCIAEKDSILCCTTICISIYDDGDVGIVYILDIINKVAIKCMHTSFCISIHLSFG